MIPKAEGGGQPDNIESAEEPGHNEADVDREVLEVVAAEDRQARGEVGVKGVGGLLSTVTL